MKKIIFTTLFIIVSAAISFASSGGEGGGEHGSNIMGVVWQLVNFGILVFVLVYFGRKPFREFLRQRSETIKKSLDEAREAKELAQKALDEVQARMKNKDKEIEEIIAASVSSGERERERIIEEGKRLSQQILEQAKSNVELELKEAREAIKAEAVQLAMEIAQKKIEGKVDEETQRRLVEEALGKLEAKK